MIDEPGHDESVPGHAATEQREAPQTQAEALDLTDKYDQMMRLAELFDSSGEEMRQRVQLGADIINDPDFTGSAALTPQTHATAEDAIRTATTGRDGLLTSSVELDADALVLRATVLTYRWIDDLQDAAFKTLGSIAGRAIGYLAPEVALGGAIVSAGLIETDALDRDGVAAYLSELADKNPELMEHVTSGGGGLLDGLQMRSLLTAGVLAGEQGPSVGRGGLRAMGVTPFVTHFGAALRDTAGGLIEAIPVATEPDTLASSAPRTLADLMSALEATTSSITVQKITRGRYIAYLSGPDSGPSDRLRLVGGDHTAYAEEAVRCIEAAVADDPGAHVMLVGSAQGGVTAAEIAATISSGAFIVDQVVTAGAPRAHVPRIPEATRMLSLEDRADPVALLGSLMSASSTNRLTVVFDTQPTGEDSIYVTAGKAADGAAHPELRAEILRIQALGYLAG